MHFNLLDRVIHQDSDSITTIKHVSAAEEYLQDHFPGFPVLPGVMMIEAITQAARHLAGTTHTPLVLAGVKALKYGQFVQPGDTLRTTLHITRRNDDGTIECKAKAERIPPLQTEPDGVACSGQITLRPANA